MSQSPKLQGLSDLEARGRLQRDGPNALPRDRHRSLWRIVLEVVREPMLALLIVGGLMYLLLGDVGEAVMLMVFASLSVVITVVQEFRTERVLESLRDLASPRALVIRDGKRRQVSGAEVVRGDLVVLSEGDRVPADARLLEGDNLLADESLLTGESVPVRKRISEASELAPRPGGEDLAFVYSGSLIVRGEGIAEVEATGPHSELGKIGNVLGAITEEPSRLQKETRRIVRLFGMFAGVLCLVVMLLYGILRGGWLKGLLSAIALAMALLPEEFPVVLTVFMAMGAWRISRARVLTRKSPAIEALGAATVLCTDKTGTLTENRMTVAELRLETGEIACMTTGAAIPTSFRDLVKTGILASSRVPFDPMEKALCSLGRDYLADDATPPREWRVVRSYGLRADLLAVTHVWATSDGKAPLIVATKGAPEAIFALCRFGPDERRRLMTVADTMAAEGLRILGVARSSVLADHLPDNPRDFDFTFLGFVGLADALRPSAPAAIAECFEAGIRVVMITGDYPVTAQAIANRAGIGGGSLLTGEALAALTDLELAKQVRSTSVFARIMPEQKLRIVKALKANGDVVAMTGDGVNDAPSLKAADIGIAMGGRGTDVAREAASIVLLDDDFSSIVKAIRLGRQIYDNLRKAMAFIVAVHVPIAGLAIMPLVFGWPILFGPVHIAFLEMIIDPACSLVFEAEDAERDVMRRPPRASDKPLFSLNLISWGLLQGTLALAAVATILVAALKMGLPESETRALTFLVLVSVVICLVLVNRSFSASPWKALYRPGLALLLVVGVAVATLTLTLTWPYARHLFLFAPLHAGELILVPLTGFVVLIALEFIKPFWRRHLFARPR